MSMLDADPNSKDYYTIRSTTLNKKTGVRKYEYTPAKLMTSWEAMGFSNNYRNQLFGNTTVRHEMFMYDYKKRAWLPIPGF